MSDGPEEITREYRLEFNNNDPAWNDFIAPEISSRVLARRVTHVINRTSLLAWSLSNISSVEVADLTASGSMEIRISTGRDFDEDAFKAEVAEVLATVRQVKSSQLGGSRVRSSSPRLNVTEKLLSTHIGGTPALVPV
jgi:hypothetical protein